MSSEEEGPVAWLRAAIEARKAVAEAATPGPWAFEGDDPTDDELYSLFDTGPDDLFCIPVAFTRDRQVANGQHMALNDPQDTIARCEAELAILDACVPSKSTEAALEAGDISTEEYVTGEVMGSQIIRLLAGGYKHRPGFPAAFAAA